MPLSNSDLESGEEEEEEEDDDDDDREEDEEDEEEDYNDEYSFLQNQVPKKFTLKNYKKESNNDTISKRLYQGQKDDDKENQYNIQEINLKKTSKEAIINNEHIDCLPTNQTSQEVDEIMQEDVKQPTDLSQNTLRKRKPLTE